MIKGLLENLDNHSYMGCNSCSNSPRSPAPYRVVYGLNLITMHRIVSHYRQPGTANPLSLKL